jgi:hypothetical protein
MQRLRENGEKISIGKETNLTHSPALEKKSKKLIRKGMRMKKTVFVLHFLLLAGFSAVAFSQSATEYQKASGFLSKKGEVYFSFTIINKSMLDTLTKTISIDNVNNMSVFAYANTKEFSQFLKFNIAYQVLPHPGDAITNPKMFDLQKGDSKAWDSYPTYESYVSLMQQFASQYPNLCSIVDAGATVQNRRVLFAKISENVNVDAAKPHVMYTSSMHGDETAGYIMLLHLIDSLLTGYSVNQDIRDLVNNTVIWINPLANPDGTYAAGNSTVTGATRYNANSIDLNRNYPNHLQGEHPDGAAWQPETQIMMNIASSQQFTLSANFHAGVEVLNYPWDSWTSAVRISADDLYWQNICRNYADTVHAHSPANYMSYRNNGVTNGGDWYIAYGTRQDYMAYYRGCREVTIELSNTKLVPTSDLVNYWNYNYRSLFNFVKEASNGVYGRITSSESGTPIRATVSILAHDRDNSEVMSTTLFGDYYRPIQAGLFTAEVRATGYLPQVRTFTAQNNLPTRLDFPLIPLKTSNKITLSGTMLTAAGAVVGSPTPVTYNATIKLYAHAIDNVLRYTENFLIQNAQGITIENGNFTIALGTGTTTDNLQNILLNNNNLWTEVTIDNDVLSRVPLTASPFKLTQNRKVLP